MTKQHTPGPWRYCYSNDVGPDDEYFIEFFEVVNPLGDVIARVDEKPDASLIAATPELLEALRQLCADELHTQEKWDNARAAIAKATGEQE